MNRIDNLFNTRLCIKPYVFFLFCLTAYAKSKYLLFGMEYAYTDYALGYTA